VKLLLDENLSSRLLELLAADFADSTHVERLGMRGATDAAIWVYAREHGTRSCRKTATFASRRFSTARRQRLFGCLSGTLELPLSLA